MRHQLTTHPIRTLGGLLAVAFVLFMLSGIPALKNAHGWNLADALGYVTWLGFLLTFLVFLVSTGYVVVRRNRRTA
jgi:hypothetical protein